MISRAPVTMAFSVLLATATGIPVGRGRKPKDAPPPYYLLYSLPASYSGAPFSDLNEDASLIYQVTPVSGPDPDRPDSYGVADQAEWMADRAREVAYGRDPVTGLWLHQLVIPGARVIGRGPDDTEPGGSSDPADAIMSYVQRFRFDLTAA